jgi:hypothetical protein
MNELWQNVTVAVILIAATGYLAWYILRRRRNKTVCANCSAHVKSRPARSV